MVVTVGALRTMGNRIQWSLLHDPVGDGVRAADLIVQK
jgi:hypothetical protein